MAINERLYTRVYWNLNNACIYYLVIPSTNKREVERIKTIHVCTFVLFHILLRNILILNKISEYVEEQNIMQRCGKTWDSEKSLYLDQSTRTEWESKQNQARLEVQLLWKEN